MITDPHEARGLLRFLADADATHHGRHQMTRQGPFDNLQIRTSVKVYEANRLASVARSLHTWW